MRLPMPTWIGNNSSNMTDRYERPAEVDLLIGDPAKAKKQLGWEPKVRFQELVKIMVDADLEMVRGDIEGSGAPNKAESSKQ